VKLFAFRFSCRRFFFITPVIVTLFIVRPCRATISYEVSLAQPSQHLFHVTMTVPEVHGDLLLQMPAWNALYEIRDFSSRVERVEATSGLEPLDVEK